MRLRMQIDWLHHCSVSIGQQKTHCLKSSHRLGGSSELEPWTVTCDGARELIFYVVIAMGSANVQICQDCFCFMISHQKIYLKFPFVLGSSAVATDRFNVKPVRDSHPHMSGVDALRAC